MESSERNSQEYKNGNFDSIPFMIDRGFAPLSAAEFFLNRDKIIRQLGDIHVNVSDMYACGDAERDLEGKIILTVDNQGRITDNGWKALQLYNSINGGFLSLEKKNYLYDSIKCPGVIPLSRKRFGRQGRSAFCWRILLRDPNEVPAEFAYDQEQVKESLQRALKTGSLEPDSLTAYTLASNLKTVQLGAWYINECEGRAIASATCTSNSVNFVDRHFVFKLAPEEPDTSDYGTSHIQI